VLRLYKVVGFIYVLHLPEICCIDSVGASCSLMYCLSSSIGAPPLEAT
jgi:hypothetical protein